MIELKTIKEIAESANISKTSVYNLIKRNKIQTFKKEGVTYLDEKAENLIIAYYSGDRYESIEDVISTVKEGKTQTIKDEFQHSKLDEYSRFISILEKELDEKNKAIQGLIQALTAEKISDSARLMLQDNEWKTVTKSSVPEQGKEYKERKSIFKWLFKKNNVTFIGHS